MCRCRWLVLFMLLCSAGAWAEIASAPAFSLKNLSGEEVKLESFLGKVLILNFWAVYCPPCRDEIPSLINLKKKFAGNGLEIVGISVDQNPDKVSEFVTEQQIPFPVLMGTKEVSQAFGGINAIPTTFLIDRNLNIVKKHIGLVEQKTFEEELRQLFDGAVPASLPASLPVTLPVSVSSPLVASDGEAVPVRQPEASEPVSASGTP